MRDWVKRLGQWHLAGDDGCTKCGCPMLGSNYANIIPQGERIKCLKCHDIPVVNIAGCNSEEHY